MVNTLYCKNCKCDFFSAAALESLIITDCQYCGAQLSNKENSDKNIEAYNVNCLEKHLEVKERISGFDL